jgi:peptide deformylase
MVSIVQTGAPLLRARAAEVSSQDLATREIQELVRRMIDTMREAPGVGLAAPQIGISLRLIVLEDKSEMLTKIPEADRRERERTAFGVRVFANPVLRHIGDEQATFFEGCLSVEGFVGLVPRSAEVEVTGLDQHGAPQTWRVRGWPARILQHEVDHLDGTLYIDRMLTRSFAAVEQAKEHYAGKSVAEVRELLGITS